MSGNAPDTSGPRSWSDLARMKRPLSIPRGKTAMISIDMQEEHRKDQLHLVEDFDRVIANVALLQRAARGNGIKLIHCAYVVDMRSGSMPRFHPAKADGTSVFSDKDDPLTAVCPEVAPQGGERLLIKSEASAFGDGSLARELRAMGAEWLFVAGAWSEACVDATVRDAVALGLHVVLVKDACGSGTEAMHRTAVLNLANRLYGGAVTDTSGALRLISGETVDAWQVEGAVPIRFTFETASSLYDAL
jgi:maleamate amidohydrolase